MTKYTIKNCPCYDDYEECLNTPRDVYKHCVDISDCFLKKIVDKCNKAQKTQWVNNKKKPYSPSKAAFAREILNLLEIEEIND